MVYADGVLQLHFTFKLWSVTQSQYVNAITGSYFVGNDETLSIATISIDNHQFCCAFGVDNSVLWRCCVSAFISHTRKTYDTHDRQRFQPL